MLKLILLSLAVATCSVRSLALNSESNSKRSWADFLDSKSADGGDSLIAAREGAHCPIQSKCLSLKRITISCDATVVSTGCGACIDGYYPNREIGEIICVPASKSGNSGVVIETEQKIDALAAELRESESDQHLAVRKDETGMSNGSAAAGPLLPPPPPPPPSKRRPTVSRRADYAFYVILGVTSGLGLLLLVICVVCWYQYNLGAKHAESDLQSVDYASPAFGTSGDGKLALSAQMYHYQHQKQQMLAMERSNSDLHIDASDDDSDLSNDEADFTVYECPGLAPTKEMEVRNPLFKEEVAPQPNTLSPSAAAGSLHVSAHAVARK